MERRTDPIAANVAQRALERADAAVAEGDHRGAIDVLTEAYRSCGHDDLLVALVRLRAEAFAATELSPPPRPWPAPRPDRFPGGGQLPEVGATELELDTLASALEHHGSLLVRGLLDTAQVDRLVGSIDATMDALGEVMAGADPTSQVPWFLPFEVDGNDLGGPGRFWAAAGGTVWAAESPRAFFDLLEVFDAVGLPGLLSAYFEEPAVLSVVKTSLRRLPPAAPGGWHQDAYVYGLDTRTVNVWIALTDCGPAGAPGLDVVPRKFHDLAEDLPPPPPLVPVSDETIRRLDAETPVQRPHFAPGDALLFDSLFLHQTGTGPGFTESRHGIESWFFAASTCPAEWVPLVY